MAKKSANSYYSNLWYAISIATKVSNSNILAEHGRIFRKTGETAPLPKKDLLISDLSEWVNQVKMALKRAKISKKERDSLSKESLALKRSQMKNAQAQLRALSKFCSMLVGVYSSTESKSTKIKDIM